MATSEETKYTEEKSFRRWYLASQYALVMITVCVGVVAYLNLRVLNKTLGQTRHSVNATEQAARAAALQAATSQKELALSQIPWVLAIHDIEKPLTFLENGFVVLVLRETMQNSGGSTAINVSSWADLVPLGPDETWKPALARQSEYCDQHRRWEDELKTNLTGFILFPKQEREMTEAMGLLPDDLAKAVSGSTDSHKRIAFAVVGCVWYRTLFEPKNSVPAHQTRFAYLLGSPLGPPEATSAALQSGLPIGTQPMIEPKGTPKGLRLIPEPMGNSAD